MTITVVDATPYCANVTCRVPLRLSRSVAQGGCCCCRGDHAPDVLVGAPGVATLPAASGFDARGRASHLAETGSRVAPSGPVSHTGDAA